MGVRTDMRATGLAGLSVMLMLVVSMVAQAAAADDASWWNRDWRYRVRVEVPSLVTTQTVTAWVDFAALLKDLGRPADPLDINSIRVVEHNPQTSATSDISFLFEERIGETPGWGWITWLKRSECVYAIYFDTQANGPKEPSAHTPPQSLLKNAVNLVPNPSFETGQTYKGLQLPANWSLAARDVATKKYRTDPDFLALGYAWSKDRARTGRKSMELLLNAAAKQWGAVFLENSIPDERIPALRGRTIHVSAFACLEGGHGVIPFRLNVAGEKGFIRNIVARPLEGENGIWFPIEATSVLDENAVRLHIMCAADIPNRDLHYYLDDFNVQAAVADLFTVSLDKRDYYLNDENIHVTLKARVGCESMLPSTATTDILDGTSGKTRMGFKVTLGEPLLKRWTMRLAILDQGRSVATRELPAQAQAVVALNAAGLPAGDYRLDAELVDDAGRTRLSVATPFKRVAGPFDN